MLIIKWRINNSMWLFVAKPLLNAKNVINGDSLYVLYDICHIMSCFFIIVISCCFVSIFTAAIIFYDFLKFHSTFIWKKIFITIFPFFFNGFTKTPHPLNAEQLKSAKHDESFLLMLFPIEVIQLSYQFSFS